MIEFKILSTPDKSQQAIYQHFGKEMTMGSEEADLVIDDPQISSCQIKLKWNGSSFLIENLDPSVEVRLNGKPIMDPAPLAEKDSIAMAKTQITFSRLDLSTPQAPPAYEHSMAATRFEAGSKEMAVLTVLEALAQQCSDGPASSPSAPPPIPKASAPPPLPGSKPPAPPLPKK
jgi:pSer/pThr/pTyr-binding forkhead associated (FHA) protein